MQRVPRIPHVHLSPVVPPIIDILDWADLVFHIGGDQAVREVDVTGQGRGIRFIASSVLFQARIVEIPPQYRLARQRQVFDRSLGELKLEKALFEVIV